MNIETLIDATFNPSKKIILLDEEMNANAITAEICAELKIQQGLYNGTGAEATVTTEPKTDAR